MSARTRRQKAQRLENRSPPPQVAGSSVELPYPVTLVQDRDGDGGDWVATVDALAGCTARGDTPQGALDAVSETMTAWLEAAAREGREVPEPKSVQSHSGRLLLRMPQTLHAELSRVAERENISTVVIGGGVALAVHTLVFPPSSRARSAGACRRVWGGSRRGPFAPTVSTSTGTARERRCPSPSYGLASRSGASSRRPWS